MKTRILFFTTTLTVLAFADVASAKEPPKYSDLPKGTLTTPPKAKTKPAAIGAREQAPGFNVAAPQFPNGMPLGSRHVTVIGDAQSAESLRKGQGFRRMDDASICYSESTSRFFGTEDGEDPNGQPIDWDGNLQWTVNLWPKSKDNPRAGVSAVHSERVTEKDGAFSLESVDAWVDPNTRGARVIGKASLPLMFVGSALGGVKVYAARESHNGKSFIQFVVLRSTSSPFGRGGMFAMGPDGSTTQSNGCRHARVSLDVDEKGGDSKTLMVPVLLASLDAAQAKNAPDGEKEVRSRQVKVHLSVSQTTRDKEPLVGLSFGWEGREQVQRVFGTADVEGFGEGDGD